MEFTMDSRQLYRQGQSGSQPWGAWNAGLAAIRDGSLTVPDGQPSSATAECECPDDCLRDHEND